MWTKPGISLQDRSTLSYTAVGYRIKQGNHVLYSLGKNKNGQLGHGDRINKYYPTPVKFEGVEKFGVKYLAGGDGHSFMITDDNEAYSWGSNNYGQLGYQGGLVETTPKKVEAIPKMTKVSCGMLHTLLLSNKGELYVCGDNRDAVLGIHNQKPKVYIPLKIEFDIPINEICATDFSVAVTSEGDLYMWGNTPHGYPTNNSRVITYPEIEENFKRMVLNFGMGNGFIVVMDRMNRFYSIGANDQGQLGIKHEQFTDQWSEIEDLAEREVKMISCGAQHVI